MTTHNYKGEAMLLSWSDTPAGRKITFLLPDEGEEHPFKGFKAGNKYGQSFAIITQPLDYDNPDEDSKEVKSVAGYAMSESQRCALLCGEEKFQAWLKKEFLGTWTEAELLCGDAANTEVAGQVVRLLLQVDSRREIDTNPRINEAWLSLRAMYREQTGATPA